jgi:ferric-dicitrate binding protein FerR (iron transport regulator)
MSTRDRHMSPSGAGFRHGRWIAIAAAVAVAAVVVALLVLYGGGGSSTGY